jgi:hypothetical protein
MLHTEHRENRCLCHNHRGNALNVAIPGHQPETDPCTLRMYILKSFPWILLEEPLPGQAVETAKAKGSLSIH